MISSKLKTIFGISVLLFVAHGLEEYLTGFYNIDSHFSFVFRPLFAMPIEQATFLLFQIMIWFLFSFCFLLVSGEKWQIRLMTLLGFGYLYELHHIIKAVYVGGYYPGLITALTFPILAFFYWRELSVILKK